MHQVFEHCKLSVGKLDPLPGAFDTVCCAFDLEVGNGQDRL
jgi:hypothetical protein